MSGTIAVDFDGVIHAYSKGWQDGSIYDDPVPGAGDALRSLMADYAVFIFTSRTDLRAVGDWVRDRLSVPVLVARDDCPREFWNGRDSVYITNRKLPAVAYLDDRGIRFHSWPQTLADLTAVTAPSADPAICQHEHFAAHVEVNRLTDAEGGPVTGYAADITVRCAACGQPFEWIGVPGGLSPGQPMCSVDRTELRAPIHPAAPAH